ncbi:hypothetical protein [Kocuria soli]|uniref:hypothetical protein n=1 Tax=Kocuria soli TaxID=2485125 RepID=UPI000F4FD38D|nr:hypothetical protein [Kocuria soli]
MTRKDGSISDPRAHERAQHLGLALYPADASAFSALVESSGLTRSGWVRGAIRAAVADPEIEQAIAAAGDRTGHGGKRPGAGRPPKEPGSSEQRERLEPQEEQA